MREVCLYLIDLEANHCKVYRMVDLGGGKFLAEWGRIGNKRQSMEYPMSKWYEKYNEKRSKGYDEIGVDIDKDNGWLSWAIEHNYRDEALMLGGMKLKGYENDETMKNGLYHIVKSSVA